MALDRETFRDPPARYRPAPFWSVNDLLDPAEVARQVREFDRVGYGGYFFHPRVGILTRYLSDEWMECFRAALDEGRERGMLCWIYDEDSYPSGFAAGLVTRDHPEYVGRNLVMALDEVPPDADIVARFAVRIDGERLAGCRCLSETEQPGEGERLMAFVVRLHPEAPWFNGAAYVDTLNPEAIARFLEVTHDKYAELFGDDFGGAIPGVFTDEPQCRPFAPNAIAWTDGMAEEFEDAWGYDLLARLPELFFTNDDSGRTRCHYWQTLTKRFTRTCMKQMADWCGEHDLALTGHLWEHEFPQYFCSGSFGLPEAPMQWPGVDLLGRNSPKGKLAAGGVQRQVGHVAMIKSVTGLTNQYGRRRILSETYGGGGWEMTFRDLKEVADWQCVLGVNYVNPHLSHYSLRGCRKRDFPPSFLDHTPWWPEYKLINDYTARLCYMLAEDESGTEIAVLQPISTCWIKRPERPSESAALTRFGKLFDSLLKDLLAEQWDFDVVDEMVLAEDGGVSEGHLGAGQAWYEALVVPSCDNLLGSTVTLLREFLDSGGKVVLVPPEPTLVDGAPEGPLADLFARENVIRAAPARADLTEALKPLARRPLVVEAEPGSALEVYTARRWCGASEAIFLVNITDAAGDVRLRYDRDASVENWDLLTGEVAPMAGEIVEGHTIIHTHLAAGESRLLVFRKAEEPEGEPAPTYAPAAELGDEWELELATDNLLALDVFSYRVGDEDWSAPVNVWQAQKALRERFNVQPEPELRGNRAQRFYDLWADPAQFEPVSLRYPVTVDGDPSQWAPVRLIVESGERFEIAVNGQPVPEADGTWVDACFATYPIGALLREGGNEIVMTTTFAEDTELEVAFISGRFGVWPRGPRRFVLGALPGSLRNGSWTEQGLPFFSGRLRARQEVELTGEGPWRLVASDMRSALATVRIDGQEVGHLLWPPYTVELTGVEPGKHVIELETITGLANTLGPLHWDPQWDAYSICGPSTWTGHDGSQWTDDYHLHPEGLPGRVWIERGLP